MKTISELLLERERQKISDVLAPHLMPVVPVVAPAQTVREGMQASEIFWRTREHDEEGYAEFFLGGGLASVRLRRRKATMLSKPRPRGVVKTFTSAARRRLLRLISSMRRDAMPLFVTLTYPDVFPEFAERWKRDLDVFTRRVKRQWPGASMIWRLETKMRKSGENAGEIAPHFHIFLWGVERTSELLQWISRAWYEVVGSGDEKHLRAGTTTEWIRTYRGLMFYCSKYVAKVDQVLLDFVGRWWGVIGRDLLPWADKVRVPLNKKDAADLLRYFKRFAGLAQSRCMNALTVFCDASWWFEKFGRKAE